MARLAAPVAVALATALASSAFTLALPTFALAFALADPVQLVLQRGLVVLLLLLGVLAIILIVMVSRRCHLVLVVAVPLSCGRGQSIDIHVVGAASS